jgi:PAS domain S-box-containing protein
LARSSTTAAERGADARGAWRDELLTRLSRSLFLLVTPLVAYAVVLHGWRGWSAAAIVLVPVSAGVMAAIGRRIPVTQRAAILVVALLVAGAALARGSGPGPGTVLSLLLAAVVAALVLGRGGALVALVAGAAGLLLLGLAGRIETASYWAADLPQASSWVRITVVFSVLAGLVVLLVSTAVRHAEANAEELRLAEARARSSEELFRVVVQDQNEMIVRWKPDGTRTFVNQAYCRVFGTTPEEVVGTSFFPQMAEPQRAAVISKIQSLTPLNPVATETHERLTASGETRFQEWTDRGIFDGQGQLVELQSTGRDVTERLAAQAAIQDSEERYRLLFDGNPLPMLVYDIESTRLLAVNAAAVSLYGWSRQELLRMKVVDLTLPGDPHYPEFLAGLGQPRPPVVHVGLRQQKCRDGSVIDVDLTSLEVPFGGRIARLTLARDVTSERQAVAERAKLQAAVEQAATEWQRTFDAVEQALVVFDTEARAVRLNRPAAALLGALGSEAVVGRHVRDLGSREPWPTAARLLDAAAASHAAESAEARDAGSRKAWTLTASLAPVGAGGEERLILVLAEITRLVELQDSLRRSETMAVMGSLVAGVAHEVRNPLFGISATLDTLEREYGSQPRYARFGGVLRSQLARLKQLAQDLLDYGKPSVLRMGEVRPEFVVQAAIRSCAPVAREHGVEVVSELSRELPTLSVDAGRIQQVIENLLANAIQHSPRGAVVKVAVVPEGEAGARGVCLTVEDEGPGVSPSDTAQLFEPFFSKRKGGTGLGLSIVRRIVEAHGGEVSVESGRSGARFRVRLPLRHDRAVSRSA